MNEKIAATEQTITLCPTCGQRVLIERDGSYRHIAEAQHDSEKEFRQKYQRFVMMVREATYLGPARDWRAVIQMLHTRAWACMGRSWLLLDEEAEAVGLGSHDGHADNDASAPSMEAALFVDKHAFIDAGHVLDRLLMPLLDPYRAEYPLSFDVMPVAVLRRLVARFHPDDRGRSLFGYPSLSDLLAVAERYNGVVGGDYMGGGELIIDTMEVRIEKDTVSSALIEEIRAAVTSITRDRPPFFEDGDTLLGGYLITARWVERLSEAMLKPAPPLTMDALRAWVDEDGKGGGQNL